MPPPFFTADGDSLYTPSFSVALHALNDALPLARIFHTQLDQTDFTEDTEPRPQSSQSGQGVWLEWRLDKPRVKRKGAIIAVA